MGLGNRLFAQMNPDSPSSNHPNPAEQENIISFFENRQDFNDRIGELESEVEELESNLLAHASKLHLLALQNLDLLEGENDVHTFIEFEPFAEGEGTIQCSHFDENDDHLLRGDTSDQLMTFLEVTREQLDRLSETIEKLQLPR